MKPIIPRPLSEAQLRSVMRRHPHRPLITCIKSGLRLALPVALIFGVTAKAAEIHDTVRKGDAAAVTRLLKQNPKLANLPDEDHAATPLHLAVDAGNLELVKVLLDAGAKVNIAMDDGNTAVRRAAAITNHEGIAWLYSSIRSGRGATTAESRKAMQAYQKASVLGPEEEAARLAILRLLAERDHSQLDADPNGNMTPLHFAACFPNGKAVEYLLKQGADPEAPAVGSRPLHFAAIFGNSAVVKALVERKADVNAAQLPAGLRPLHLAVTNGDIATIKLLLDHGAEVNAVTQSGKTALHDATWSDEIFNLLLERGANPKLEQNDGTTTLHKACHQGSATLVAKLLELHPDLEACDSSLFTPLLNAAESGRADLLKLLASAGADPKATQKDGRNALHLAANAANSEVVRFLLEQKLAVNATSHFGETALMIAAGAGRLESVMLLLQAGATVDGVDRRNGLTALMVAAWGTREQQPRAAPTGSPHRDCGSAADYLKIAALLLDAKAEVRAKSKSGFTALHFAALTAGNPEMLELLISKGAQVDANEAGFGQTPLHNAAYNADVQTVAVLLGKGADISTKDVAGCQAIHLAARGDNAEVIEFLIKKGAEVAAKEKHGGTPLHLAASCRRPEAARVLLAHGAPPATLDKGDWSPLHHAALNGAVDVVRLLLEHRAPVEEANSFGNTPLHHAAIVRVGMADFAAVAGQPENAQSGMDVINNCNPADKLKIAALLLAKGASLKTKNLAGATPADLAAKCGTPEILALLKSHAGASRKNSK